MKIALVTGFKNGAIDQVMQPLAKLTGADVICTFDEHDRTFKGYDLVHFGYYRYAVSHVGYIAQPITGNVWHIPSGRENDNAATIHNLGFDRIVVDDVMTLQQLGQESIFNVTPIPIVFDYEKFYPLPTPKGEFTVGVFCNSYSYKRWEIIVKACQELDIPCLAYVLDAGRTIYDLDPILDVYANCHTVAHATFVDTNSLPLREALLCGRPVIATHNDGLHQVVREGHNGLFYDGTVGDLKRAILEMKANYERLSYGALNTRMPDAKVIAAKYIKMWKTILDELDSE